MCDVLGFGARVNFNQVRAPVPFEMAQFDLGIAIFRFLFLLCYLDVREDATVVVEHRVGSVDVAVGHVIGFGARINFNQVIIPVPFEMAQFDLGIAIFRFLFLLCYLDVREDATVVVEHRVGSVDVAVGHVIGFGARVNFNQVIIPVPFEMAQPGPCTAVGVVRGGAIFSGLDLECSRVAREGNGHRDGLSRLNVVYRHHDIVTRARELQLDIACEVAAELEASRPTLVTKDTTLTTTSDSP